MLLVSPEVKFYADPPTPPRRITQSIYILTYTVV